METTIDGRVLPNHLDGDWQVTWHFTDYIIRSSVFAKSPDEALRAAENKLPWLIKEEECLGLSIELMGVYGGHATEEDERVYEEAIRKSA